MAFDGNGNFLRVHNWVQDKTNAINITASEMDGEDNGFASGLTLAVTRDGQGKMAADFLPSADNAYQLGSGGLRWTNLNLSGAINAATATLTGLSISSGLTVNLLPVRGSYNTVKTASTSRNTTTTVTNDPDLILALSAATKYRIDMYLAIQCATTTTQGFKSAFSYSGSALLQNAGLTGVANGSTIAQKNDFGGIVLPNVSITNTDFIYLTGYFATSTAGNLALQWAQNSSSGNNTTLGAGSYLIAYPLS